MDDGAHMAQSMAPAHVELSLAVVAGEAHGGVARRPVADVHLHAWRAGAALLGEPDAGLLLELLGRGPERVFPILGDAGAPIEADVDVAVPRLGCPRLSTSALVGVATEPAAGRAESAGQRARSLHKSGDVAVLPAVGQELRAHRWPTANRDAGGCCVLADAQPPAPRMLLRQPPGFPKDPLLDLHVRAQAEVRLHVRSGLVLLPACHHLSPRDAVNVALVVNVHILQEVGHRAKFHGPSVPPDEHLALLAGARHLVLEVRPLLLLRPAHLLPEVVPSGGAAAALPADIADRLATRQLDVRQLFDGVHV
mmetsp:Transcript_23622/g.67553  ORF Transcript_23622/g.67553 Transcript_23622/m.67553 type:complete len:309 (+) Transcript_23622:897-1823(+)